MHDHPAQQGTIQNILAALFGRPPKTEPDTSSAAAAPAGVGSATAPAPAGVGSATAPAGDDFVMVTNGTAKPAADAAKTEVVRAVEQFCADVNKVRADKAPAPDTKAPAPDTKAPDAKAPAPDAKAPDAKAPDAKAPDAKAPDAKAPDAKAPALDAKAPAPDEKQPAVADASKMQAIGSGVGAASSASSASPNQPTPADTMQQNIAKMAEYMKLRGYKVKYGDSDTIFQTMTITLGVGQGRETDAHPAPSAAKTAPALETFETFAQALARVKEAGGEVMEIGDDANWAKYDEKAIFDGSAPIIRNKPTCVEYKNAALRQISELQPPLSPTGRSYARDFYLRCVRKWLREPTGKSNGIDGVVLAGGAIFDMIMGRKPPNYDLFLISAGAASVSQDLARMMNEMHADLQKYDNAGTWALTYDGDVLKFNNPGRDSPEIKIHLADYKTIGGFLQSVDIDVSAVVSTGKKYYMTRAAAFSYENMCIILDPAKNSKDYIDRIGEYANCCSLHIILPKDGKWVVGVVAGRMSVQINRLDLGLATFVRTPGAPFFAMELVGTVARIDEDEDGDNKPTPAAKFEKPDLTPLVEKIAAVYSEKDKTWDLKPKFDGLEARIIGYLNPQNLNVRALIALVGELTALQLITVSLKRPCADVVKEYLETFAQQWSFKLKPPRAATPMPLLDWCDDKQA